MTTQSCIDTLRSLVETLNEDGLKEDAARIEAAADYLDDLAERLCTAEDDIARLHAQTCAAERALDNLTLWVTAARHLLPVGGGIPRPQDVPDECWPQQFQNREETPTL